MVARPKLEETVMIDKRRAEIKHRGYSIRQGTACSRQTRGIVQGGTQFKSGSGLKQARSDLAACVGYLATSEKRFSRMTVILMEEG